MAIYRGIGGSGNSTSDAYLNAVTEKAVVATTAATDAANSASTATTQASTSTTKASEAAASAATATTKAGEASASALAASDSAAAALVSENNTANKLPLAGGTLTGNVSHSDNIKSKFGASDDLVIHHDTSNGSTIDHSGAHDLLIKSSSNISLKAGAQTYMTASAITGGVHLNHILGGMSTSEKLKTTSVGVTVTGNIDLADNGKLLLGNDDDLQIYHDAGGDSYIKESGDGNLYIEATNLRVKSANGATYIAANQGDAVTLYHDNAAKIATKSSGVDVTGTVTASTYTGTATDFRSTGSAYLTYGSSSDNLIIRTDNGSERMRIDSSGNVLVGKSAVEYTSEGMALRERGEAYITSSGRAPLLVNRLTSDGEIITLKKDGTTVGSIGVVSGSNFYINNGDTGICFRPSGDDIVPVSTGGSGRDNAIDLGASGARFKDLYLSGGVVFGDAGGTGTSASNTLDSYEEGTFTPTVNNGTLSVSSGNYTKVGRAVTISVVVGTFSDTTTSTVISIQGLPFTADGDASSGIMFQNVSASKADSGCSAYIGNNNTTVQFYGNRVAAGWLQILNSDLTSSGAYFRFSMTYFTD